MDRSEQRKRRWRKKGRSEKKECGKTFIEDKKEKGKLANGTK